MRHNDIRDLIANLLRRVCNDVETELMLQPTRRETMSRSTINGNEARLDIRARGFWRRGLSAFFYIRVTNTNTDSARYTASMKWKRKGTITIL